MSRYCRLCHTSLTGKRKDALFCDQNCRKKWQRRHDTPAAQRHRERVRANNGTPEHRALIRAWEERQGGKLYRREQMRRYRRMARLEGESYVLEIARRAGISV